MRIEVSDAIADRFETDAEFRTDYRNNYAVVNATEAIFEELEDRFGTQIAEAIVIEIDVLLKSSFDREQENELAYVRDGVDVEDPLEEEPADVPTSTR